MVILDEKDKKTALLLEDLAALEGYIHDLFTFSPLPICFASPLGVILEANPAFEKISNFSINEIVGEPIERVFEKEAVQKLTTDTLEKGIIEGREMMFIPKETESFNVQVFTRARKDEKGKAVGFFLGVFDLTTIKKAEKELKKTQTALLNILEDTEEARRMSEEEKKKTQAIIASFTDGLLVFDQDKTLTMANPQGEEFLKIGSQGMIGKSLSEFSKLENLKGLIGILGKEMKGIFRKEWVVEENFVLEISTIPLMLGEEETGTLVVLHDISREKIVERLKTEFVSISAHQLRTPLSAIKWTLRMLLDGDLGGISPEQTEYLEKTYRSNERMISLINSLLNVTRIEEGRFIYKPIWTEMDKLVESMIDTLKDEAKRREIELKFEKIGQIPKILVDDEKMKLAVQNLIENAVIYTLSGGRVIVTLKATKEELEFSVKDTGLGVPKDQQERVFTKFFRAANAMRLDTEGSGLGLFITKNVIEAHGGKIWFESEENKGSTFYFTLPLKKGLEEFLEKL